MKKGKDVFPDLIIRTIRLQRDGENFHLHLVHTEVLGEGLAYE